MTTAAAFESYENRLRPFVEGKQKGAEGFARSFVPDSALGVWTRNQATKLLRLPWIGEWVVARSVSVRDDFELPDYAM